MRNKLIIITVIVCTFYLTAVNVISYLFNGGFVSKSTEAKYLRNIDKYELIHKNYFYTRSDNGQDTLAGYIADNAHYQIEIFSKWHIRDLGLVRRGGKLHKKLDSLAKLWVEPKNNYK